MITPDGKTDEQKTDRPVSRRVIAKKIAYAAPAVLAVVAATERPALAQSHHGRPRKKVKK
jgi:hypothetical protein